MWCLDIRDNIMKSLAFYTVFTGGKNNPAYIVPNIQQGHDNYFFTNNQRLYDYLKTTPWIPRFLEEKTGEDSISSTMDSKVMKANPFLSKELSEYDYTCFHDTKLQRFSLEKVYNIINEQYAMALRQHWFLGPKVYDEFNESMLQERYLTQKDQILAYIHKMESKGLALETPHHIACGFIVRNMKHKDVKKIGETWYEHIKECGIQDQISMFFVKQLFDSECFRVLHDSEVF